MTPSTTEFEKAIHSLIEALEYSQNKKNPAEFKIFRDACIQRFEFCIELAWKTSAKVMGSTSTASKIVIREMARNGFVDNPQIWFDFLEARNNTSHSYDEDVAQKVYLVAQKFPPEGLKLLEILNRK